MIVVDTNVLAGLYLGTGDRQVLSAFPETAVSPEAFVSR